MYLQGVVDVLATNVRPLLSFVACEQEKYA